MFANPKAALGFAGVTIAIAIAASFGASAFFPGSDAETEVIAETEAVPETPTKSAPAANVAWADDGFSDDWNASAVDTASGNGSSSNSGNSSEPGESDFGDYTPEERGASSATNRSSSSRPTPASGPRIRSGAASGAPALNPPGSGGGELEQVD